MKKIRIKKAKGGIAQLAARMMTCSVMSSHVKSSQVMLCYIIRLCDGARRSSSFQLLLFLQLPFTSHHIISHHITSLHTTSLHFTPHHICLSAIKAFAAACPILSYPILSYPILSYPILSYPIHSNPIHSYPILAFPHFLASLSSAFCLISSNSPFISSISSSVLAVRFKISSRLL